MDNSSVVLEVEGPLARITLNRPDVLNAENSEWIRALEAAVRTVATETGVRVVLVRGAGRAFCAGMDLEMMSRRGMPDGFYEGQERAFRDLELMDKITPWQPCTATVLAAACSWPSPATSASVARTAVWACRPSRRGCSREWPSSASRA